MFGWLKGKSSKREDRAQRDNAEPEVAEAPKHAAGPIPHVGADTGATSGDHATASEQAYTTKGKDPKYKDKGWAESRLFEQLDPEQRRMLDELNSGDGAELWDGLALNLRAGFLNITAALKGNGFDLGGLSLLPLDGTKNSGIQQDRLMFTPGSAENLRAPLENAINNREQLGDRGFLRDKPEEKLHQGMADWGGRQWVTRFSMQVGGGPAGAFVDIDEWGPKVDVAGTLGHMFEVLGNKTSKSKTDPFKVARGLDKRGDDP